MTGIRDTVGLSVISDAFARDSVGLSEIGEIHIRDLGGLNLVYNQGSALAVYVPASAYGAASSNTPVAISTEVIIATPSGGVAPYTYSWTRADGGIDSWTIIFPSSQETSFRANSVASGVIRTATFKVTVTDAQGQFVDSININATAENYGGFA